MNEPINPDPILAARKADELLKQVNGEFAYLNNV